jgi:hypothetical protein
LVILGSGWGSTSLLKGLNTEEYNVIVVSPRNYFLFTRTINWNTCINDSFIALYNHGIGGIEVYYAAYPPYS